MCLVVDSISGKTSLFFPFLGLVHHGNLVTVTKQCAFTEVVFIYEALESAFDIADSEILTRDWWGKGVRSPQP